MAIIQPLLQRGCNNTATRFSLPLLRQTKRAGFFFRNLSLLILSELAGGIKGRLTARAAETMRLPCQLGYSATGPAGSYNMPFVESTFPANRSSTMVA